ncbi:MAG: hypothetical protein GX639_13150 [Fibrobacter sp.]|nr:hypothetical protein [Fibrobacter sp.]
MVSAICNFFISSICTIQNFGTSLLGFIKIEHGFIELMAGIEGAILALAIPLSHESVLKMSERYNSETVSALFQKKKRIIVYPYLLTIGIISCLTLGFFYKENAELIFWKLNVVIAIVLFITNLIMLLIFFHIVKKYTTTSNFVLNEHLRNVKNKIEKCLSYKNNKMTKCQEYTVANVESVCDILVFEMRRKKNEIVKHGLREIEKILHKLQENSSRFNNEFHFGVLQLIRVYEETILAGNEEISIEIGCITTGVLKKVVKTSERTSEVTLILSNFLRMYLMVNKTTNRSVILVTTSWYIDILFGSDDVDDFKLEYLDLMDSYFIVISKNIIKEGNDFLFKTFANQMNDGIHKLTPTWPDTRQIYNGIIDADPQILDESNPVNSILKKVENLDAQQKNIFTIEELFQWLDKLNIILSEYESLIDTNIKEVLSNSIKVIRTEAINAYKLDNVDITVFGLAGFCLYAKKYNYVKLLIEYNQPDDASAHYMGRGIFPRSLNELIRFFFKYHYLIKEKFHNWDEHSGSEKYINMLFLILCSKFIHYYNKNDAGEYLDFNQITIPELNIYRLRDIDFHANQLLPLIKELSDYTELYTLLKINTENLFDEKLPKLCQLLIEKSNEKISSLHKDLPVNKNKVNDFIESFKIGYMKNAIVRKYFVCTNETTDEYKNSEIKMGENVLYDKSAFLDEWYIRYPDLGKHAGEVQGINENVVLFSRIAKKCKKTNFNDIQKLLSNQETYIAIAFSNVTYIHLQKVNAYTPNWKKSSKDDTNTYGNFNFINGILPLYCKIPLYQVRGNIGSRTILILNVKKVGEIIQYLPPELDNAMEMHNNFITEFHSFSEENEFLENYLKINPRCVEDLTTDNEKIEYLNRHVLIKINQYFEARFSDDFEGYTIDVE